MGIDPSLASTGFAYRRREDGDVYLGTITSEKLRGPQRLSYMRDRLADLVDEVLPDIVIYEGYAMGGKGRVFNIGELGGVFLTMLYERGITVEIVPPTTLKMAITGAGAAGKAYKGVKNPNKAAMRDAIRTRYGFDIQQDDEADAYALLMTGEHHHGLTAAPQAIGKSSQALATLGSVLEINRGKGLQTIAKKGMC